ncbi:MAG: hypothetical protein OEM52_14465 [bacterium]|nr:hypothetical protein [bacterium]
MGVVYRMAGRSVFGMLFRVIGTILFWLFIALLKKLFSIGVARKQKPLTNPVEPTQPPHVPPDRNPRTPSKKQDITDAEWHQL